MRRLVALTATGVLAAALLTGCRSDAPSGESVTVFAAASLTEAFTAIAALDPTLGVTFSFDGSAREGSVRLSKQNRRMLGLGQPYLYSIDLI